MSDEANIPENTSALGWRLRAAAPYLAAVALFLLGLLALYHLLAPVDLHEVAAQVHATPWTVTGLALASTLAGYLCLAGYDWSALRYRGKSLPPPVVLSGGLMAYAFGNTLGLTPISGGAVRWRVYSGLGLDGYDIAAIANSAQTRIVAGATGIIAVSAVGCSASAPSPTSVVITPKDTEVKVEIAAMS